MATKGRSLSILVHADTKVGKSTFANTAPAPRLLLDAEAAGRFLPGRKVYWDPMRDAPPTPDGSWDTCIVNITEYGVLVRAIEWLKSGQHAFESVIIDSISEVQKKLQDQISGLNPLDMRKWGELLRHMEALIRSVRDLTEHPTTPISALVITAMTEMRDGKWRPYVQGQLRTTMPYFLDVVCYEHIVEVEDADPTKEGTYQLRRLLTRQLPGYEAGERVQGRLPMYIDGENVNVNWMLDQVFGKLEEKDA